MMNENKHKVVYRIKGGTWENKTKMPLTEYVEDNNVSRFIPAYMRHKFGRRPNGSWDKDPYTTRITEDTVFTYKYKVNPFFAFAIYSLATFLIAITLFVNNSFAAKQKPAIKDNTISVGQNMDYSNINKNLDDNPSRDPNYNSDSVSFEKDKGTKEQEQQQTYYTITFANIDGSVLQTKRYQKGDIPSYSGSTPTYSDNEYKYTFAGWGSISSVTGNATYTAQYSKERKEQLNNPTPTPAPAPAPQVTRYTITTSVNDATMGSVTGGNTYDENSTATLTATANTGYHFVKWSDENTDNPRSITVTSNASYQAVFELTMPIKGDVIVLKNIYGNDPTAEYRFRVLSIDGNEAKLLALFNASNSQVFNSRGSNVYADSNLDTYLNTTWYGTLSDTMKSAIGDGTTDLQQHSYCWYSGTPSDNNYVAKGTYSSGTSYYYITEETSDIRDIGNRYVFALDVQDVIDYLDGEDLSKDKINTMFNTTGQYVFVWLRSARAGYSGIAWAVDSDSGYLSSNNVRNGSSAVRPAFNIDLSKEGVVFTIETEE